MSEKDRALTAALSQIERSYGKGAIMKLGEAAAQRNIDVIPTGSLTLDMALGVGGIPRGRVVEIYGPESSGKTTLALHVIAQSQKLGGVAAFIDAEHALDKFYASVRLDIRKIDSIKNGLDVTGNRVKVKVVKNKVAPPFRSAEFDILYNEGISYWGSVLDAAVDATLVEKSGSWFSCNGQRLGQGREQTVGFLKANPKLGEELIAQLKGKAAEKILQPA
jgi:RecA/RadA recombinase